MCVNNYLKKKKTIKPKFHFNRLQSTYKCNQNLITITIYYIAMVSVCIKEYLTLFKLTIAHCFEQDKTINNYIFKFIESHILCSQL